MSNADEFDLKKKQVEREGWAVLRLCEELGDHIQEGRSRKTYLIETEKFINYIQDSINIINIYVKDIIQKLREDSIDQELVQAKHRGLGQTKNVLGLLYMLTKDVIDADSLSIPFSLSIFINEKTKEIQGLKNASLVIFGTSDLNFYQRSLKKLRVLSLVLHEEIVDFPIFSSDISILHFPYSTAKQILVNCILFHEMGHFVYENTNMEPEFKQTVKRNLPIFLDSNPEIARQTKFPLYISKYVWHLLRKWVNEIFADIFAIRILGPAYHFAYLEMVQLIPTNIEERNRTFTNTHPADDYRFRIQGIWLKKGRWDKVLKEKVRYIFDNLEKCQEQTSMSVYKINCRSPIDDKNSQENLHSWMLEQFENMVKIIEGKIEEKLKLFEEPIKDFEENDEAVTACLEHGIVPSSIYRTTQEQAIHSNPTTLLNSGYFFYLTGMKKLLEKVKINNNISDIDTQLFYMKRLNQWLAKGIEDWQIMKK